MRTIILAGAMLLTGLTGPAYADAPAASQEPPLADLRLSDPETFARFADVSAPRPAGVFVPVWRGPQAAQGRRHGAELTPMTAPTRSALISIPAPTPPVSPSSLGSRTRSTPSPLGVAILTATAILLAGRRGRPQPPHSGSSLPPTATYLKEKPVSPTPALPPKRPTPPPLWTVTAVPPPEPAPRQAAPKARLPWWAITAAEQEAIYRWDVSPEKRFEGKSLDFWLDAHQGEIKGVNIWRLKEKLWRDA